MRIMLHSTLFILAGTASLAGAQSPIQYLPWSHRVTLAVTPRDERHGESELHSPASSLSELLSTSTFAPSMPSFMDSSAIATKTLGVPPVVEPNTSTSMAPIGRINHGQSTTTTESFTASFAKTLTPTTDLLGLGIPPLTEGSCYPISDGRRLKPADDTTLAFLKFREFSELALSASTPSNYTCVYADEHAASFFPSNYMQWLELSSYNPIECSTQCNDMPICQGFNIYFERKPTVQLGPNCPTSPSSTYIKCAFYSAKLDKSTATNKGFLERKFEHVIAGSNAYNKNNGVAAKGIASSIVVSAALLAVTIAAALVGSNWLIIDSYRAPPVHAQNEG